MSGPLEPDAYKAHTPPHMDEMDRQAQLVMTSIAISFKRIADALEHSADTLKQAVLVGAEAAAKRSRGGMG